MRIRELKYGDLRQIKKIHEEFFEKEFEFPNFDQIHVPFIIDNADGEEIILAGGVRPIAELICITNKHVSTRKRVIALKEAVNAGLFVCGINEYDQLHCFVQGEEWSKQVQTVGFRPTKGQSLVLDVG